MIEFEYSLLYSYRPETPNLGRRQKNDADNKKKYINHSQVNEWVLDREMGE